MLVEGFTILLSSVCRTRYLPDADAYRSDKQSLERIGLAGASRSILERYSRRLDYRVGARSQKR
jgi:hypothetical protein